MSAKVREFRELPLKKHGDVSSKSEWHRSYEIAETFWALPLLKKLLDLDGLRKHVNSRELHDDLAKGYAFCIVSLLWELAHSIITWPELFDLERDRALGQALLEPIPLYRMSTRSLAGQTVRKITLLFRPLMEVQSFDAIDRFLQRDLVSWIANVVKIFECGYALAPEIRKRTGLNLLQTLELASISNLLRSLQDIRVIKSAFYHTYRKSTIWPRGLPIRLADQDFFGGYKLALSYLWHQAAKVRQDSSEMIAFGKAKTWKELDSLFDSFLHRIVEPLLSRNKFQWTDFLVYSTSVIFLKTRKLPKHLVDLMCSLPSEYLTQPQSETERLDEAFMGYPTFVSGTQLNYDSSVGFLTALSGATKRARNEVFILRFVHGFEKQAFSFAILIETYDDLRADPYWWIFPECCTDSGSGSIVLSAISKQLAEFGPRIRVQDVNVDLEKFRLYTKGFAEERHAIDISSLRSHLSYARAGLFEVFYALLMQSRGFTVFWRYRNPRILGDYEIDVLSLEQSGIRMEIAECTLTASRDDLERLMRNTKLVEKNRVEIIRHIGGQFPPGSLEIKATLVVLRPTELKTGDKVELRSENWLASECRKVGLSWAEVKELFH